MGSSDRIMDYFGKWHGLPDITQLKHIARLGLPTETDLAQEISNGDHLRAAELEEVRREAIADLVEGRVLMFPLEQAGGIQAWATDIAS